MVPCDLFYFIVAIPKIDVHIENHLKTFLIYDVNKKDTIKT